MFVLQYNHCVVWFFFFNLVLKTWNKTFQYTYNINARITISVVRIEIDNFSDSRAHKRLKVGGRCGDFPISGILIDIAIFDKNSLVIFSIIIFGLILLRNPLTKFLRPAMVVLIHQWSRVHSCKVINWIVCNCLRCDIWQWLTNNRRACQKQLNVR